MNNADVIIIGAGASVLVVDINASTIWNSSVEHLVSSTAFKTEAENL